MLAITSCNSGPAKSTAPIRSTSIPRIAPLHTATPTARMGSIDTAHTHTTQASLSGTWALKGTGPVDLVPRNGRLGTILLRRHGSQLSGLLHAVGVRSAITGSYDRKQTRVTLRWHLPKSGVITFSGTLQAGGKRILGVWSDRRGDDGGIFLVRTTG